jgi:hypothetical protein
VESSYELCNKPSGSIKCWELPSGCTSCGLSSGTVKSSNQRVWPSLRPLLTFRDNIFNGEKLMTPCPISKLEDHPYRLSMAAYTLYLQLPSLALGCLLTLVPKDAPCHGDIEPTTPMCHKPQSHIHATPQLEAE